MSARTSRDHTYTARLHFAIPGSTVCSLVLSCRFATAQTYTGRPRRYLLDWEEPEKWRGAIKIIGNKHACNIL